MESHHMFQQVLNNYKRLNVVDKLLQHVEMQSQRPLQNQNKYLLATKKKLGSMTRGRDV